MQDAALLEMLRLDKTAWNLWRKKTYPEVVPNFMGANLRGLDLMGADLRRVELAESDLRETNLHKADLYRSSLWRANLSDATLSEADLSSSNLNGANLERANLSSANLRFARLTAANVADANLSGCFVYGCSLWNLKGIPKEQANVVITPRSEPAITIDNIEVAQFVYLILNNKKIRDVIDTVGQKGVLILGRFTPDRKMVLDGIRSKLRELGFVPIMFDFERPTARDFTETIRILASLSRFIIADITNPKSSPLELQATMPEYMIPFVPIIQEDEEPFAMFRDLHQKYGEWVLSLLKYDTTENLLRVLEEAVINPALDASRRLVLKKAKALQTRHTSDFLDKKE